MKHIFSSAALVLAIWGLSTVSALAQAPADGGPAPTTTTAPATPIPIDGGVSLLLAGGVAFGMKQLRARRLARQAANPANPRKR